jgi:hypothetical protein
MRKLQINSNQLRMKHKRTIHHQAIGIMKEKQRERAFRKLCEVVCWLGVVRSVGGFDKVIEALREQLVEMGDKSCH